MADEDKGAGQLAQLYRQSGITPADLPVAGWEPVPPEASSPGESPLTNGQRRDLLAAGRRFRGYDWPAIPATAAIAFRRQGDRSAYETPHFARRAALAALALAVYAGADDLTDELVDGIWAVCEESFWGVSAHVWRGRFPESPLPDTAEPYIDLFAAATAGTLAWVDRLADHVLTGELAIVRDRIRREVQRRVLGPYVERDDWWWLGLAPLRPDQVINNWNPWIHSNILTAALLLEADATRREAIVRRAVQGLDRFLAVYAPDGGCDEGMSYWSHAGGSLFECLDLLRSATGGRFDAFSLPIVGEIGRFTYRVQIGGDWYVNFADGSARPRLDGELIAAYGDRIGDPTLRGFGHWVAERDQTPNPAGRLDTPLGPALLHLFPGTPPPTGGERPPLPRDSWLPGIEVLVSREAEGTADGLFLAAKGGTNGESHNHNDVGQFIVAVDGRPLVVDAGVGTYTRQTFSDERYRLWTMRSSHHNLPEVDGVEQAAGPVFAARDVTAEIGEERSGLSLDLAGAYPPEAGLVAWHRSVALDRSSGEVVLEDAWRLDHEPASVVLHLLVDGEAQRKDDGLVITSPDGGRGLAVGFGGGQFRVSLETVATDDGRLRPVWGKSLTRVTIAVRSPAADGSWRLVMSPTTDSSR